MLAAETAVENPGNVLRRREGEVIAHAGQGLSLGLLSSYPEPFAPQPRDTLSFAPDRQGDAERMSKQDRYRARVYGRSIQRPGGRMWLQYWLWYYDNPKHLRGFGKHEGDWEMVQVGLGADGLPQALTYAQHDGGEALELSPSARRAIADGQEWYPVVYVAPLSHASYFTARTHVYRVGIDHPRGDGPAERPPVHRFGKWAEWPGHWGNTERGITTPVIPRRVGDGPRSPGWQEPKWSRPERFHESAHRRRWRVSLGRFAHWLGGLSFPRELTVPKAELGSEQRVVVTIQLGGTGLRRARHLLITVHEGDRVLARRIVPSPGSETTQTIPVPAAGSGLEVDVSAFTWLRQRSDPVSVPLQASTTLENGI